MVGYGVQVGSTRALVITQECLTICLVGSSLLLLVLVLLVASRARQRLLQDLEDLLVLDLLIRLELCRIDSLGRGKLGDAVLGDR